MGKKTNPRYQLVMTRVDLATHLAINQSAKKLGVSRAKLVAETLAVAFGGNRTCAMS